MIRYDEMTDKQKENYDKFYKEELLSGMHGFKFLKPTSEFDSNGLRFPIEYLNSIGKYVIFLPIEEMAEYVDMIGKHQVDNQRLITQEELDFDIEKNYYLFNATSIGNLAYIGLHYKDKTIKELALKKLNEIFLKAKEDVLSLK